MISKLSLFAITLSTIAFPQLASAQVLESGWELTPQYNETPLSWPSSEGIIAPQQFEMRPYVPYPGQPGYSGSYHQPIQQPSLNFGQGYGLSFESGAAYPTNQFEQPAFGFQQPQYEQPPFELNQPLELQGSTDLGQEIIISEEPLDGTIIGIVKDDGSVTPIGEPGNSSQMPPSETPPSEDNLTPSADMGESVVGDNFGEPIVQPSPSDVVVIESDDTQPQLPPEEQKQDIELAPAETPQEVVDARNKEVNERTKLQRECEVRIREMDRVIGELKAKQEAQNAELIASKRALEEAKKSIADNFAKSKKSSESIVETNKANDIKIADLKRENSKLDAALKAATKGQTKEDSSEASKLRKKLVDTNREMVKLRRSLATQKGNLESRNTIMARLAKEKKELETETKELLLKTKDDSAKLATLKRQLAESKKASDKTNSKLADLKKSNLRSDNYKKKFDALKKAQTAALKESKSASKKLEQIAKELKESKEKHAEQIAKLDKQYKSSAETHRKAIEELATAKEQLAQQKQMNKQMKAEFIEAFEADRKRKSKQKAKVKEKNSDKPLTEAEVRDAWNKKRLEAEKKDKSESTKEEEKDSKKKKVDSKKKSDSKKEKLRKRELQLREEMKKKMAEAENRIRSVGKKKLEALAKKGKKDDSDEVKAEKENTEKSVKISDRKIRARYERKIKRLK